MPSTKQTKKTIKGRKATSKKPVEHARDKMDMNQGIYISASRVLKRFDEFGINENVTTATEEIRNGESHSLVNKETGKETVTTLVPLSDMSPATQELLEIATARYDKTQAKRVMNINKKRDGIVSAWDSRKAILAGQLATKSIAQAEYDLAISDGQSAVDVSVANLVVELETPPQLINKKKLNHTVYESEMARVQKLRYRISKGVSTTAAAACTVWVCELLRHGMDNVVAQDKSFLKCQHIFAEGVENLTYLPFYQRLPSFVAAQRAETERRAAEDEKKRVRALKKKDSADSTSTPVDVESVDSVADDDSDKCVMFVHHIKQTCLYMQKGMETEGLSAEKLEKYQSIRISEPIKTFCSNLISEFTGTLTSLVLAEMVKAKLNTVNVTHIHHALRLFLLVNNDDPEPLILKVQDMNAKYKDNQSDKNEDRKSRALAADQE
jgi:hypothetical protein